jgi:hypothetical protein
VVTLSLLVVVIVYGFGDLRAMGVSRTLRTMVVVTTAIGSIHQSQEITEANISHDLSMSPARTSSTAGSPPRIFTAPRTSSIWPRSVTPICARCPRASRSARSF